MSEKNSTSQLAYMPSWPSLSRGHIKTYAFIIDQAWGQDGWLLDKFFFAFLLAEKKSKSIRTQKRTRPIYSDLDWTSLVNKGCFTWSKETFYCGTNAGSQSQRRIRFILPARGFSRIKRMFIGQVSISRPSWSTKNSLTGPKDICSCGTESGHDMPIFPFQLANHIAAFAIFHRALEGPSA